VQVHQSIVDLGQAASDAGKAALEQRHLFACIAGSMRSFWQGG